MGAIILLSYLIIGILVGTFVSKKTLIDHSGYPLTTDYILVGMTTTSITFVWPIVVFVGLLMGIGKITFWLFEDK